MFHTNRSRYTRLYMVVFEPHNEVTLMESGGVFCRCWNSGQGLVPHLLLFSCMTSDNCLISFNLNIFIQGIKNCILQTLMLPMSSPILQIYHAITRKVS